MLNEKIVCTICEELKDKSTFDRVSKIKKSGRCKHCKSEQSKQLYKKNRIHRIVIGKRYRTTNKEKRNIQSKISYKENKEYISIKCSQYYLKNKHKLRAHYIVRKALRNGTLKRESCFICKMSDKFINNEAHAHHVDYSKPLAIWWLCKKHHMRVHARISEMGKLRRSL